ncbi:putative DHHC palmitoyltransferase family protein [Lyophyllum shimeji]|uniref:Palmitoyltransferase n=1 Tax=Lyophyllum shimeji TaxID=47721 RepID=A0A9P3PEV7_LYOSH|nr:putative DHHC palmitoyltransferase family protein [Lyophyllum shimeji]
MRFQGYSRMMQQTATAPATSTRSSPVGTMNSPSSPTFRNRGTLPLPTSLSAASTTSGGQFAAQQASSTHLPTASSPTSAHFQLHSPMLSSSTHAGGIQPSSSFFRPARPTQQYSEPEAAYHYALSPLNQERKRHSLARSSIDDQDPATDTTEDPHPNQFASLKRTKQSREPLLPIGGSGSSHARKPSVLSTATSPTTPVSSPKKSTASRVRSSLDRVFGLSFPNRMSLDSTRNRNSTLYDEERAERPFTPTKVPEEPSSPSPLRFLNGNIAPTPSSRSHSPAPSHSSSPSPAPSTPTPPPSFIATPPTPTPNSKYPLSHTPILKPNSTKLLRKYALHPARNRFLLSGRFLTGGDTPYAFLASLALLFGLAALWFSTTCFFWWHHSAGGKAIVIIGAYLAALVLSTMLTTATTDPGILPRGLDPDPPYPATSPSDGGNRVPMPRDLRVRSDVVRVKYCPTCQTYRPPRSSHCKMCDNCVDSCDHHCQWVNNCIGRRNYTTFFALLCTATTTLILIIITAALHLWLLTRLPPHRNFRHALSEHRGVGSAVAFCLSVAVIWPVGALLAYHARLLLLNVTTIEQIRNQAHKSVSMPGSTGLSKPPNPFSHGTRRRNFVSVLCRPQGFSWLDPRAVATQDLREVNPGMRGLPDVGLAGVGAEGEGARED